MVKQKFDSIIIGGGHNGLVTAIKLAKAGQRVLVLEAKDQFGGAAVTRGLAPGYNISAAAHLLHLLPKKLQRELRLEQFGLVLAAQNLKTIALDLAGNHVVFDGKNLSGGTAADQSHYPTYHRDMQELARFFAPLLASRAPRLARGKHEPHARAEKLRDACNLAMTGLRLRLLGRRRMRQMLRIIGMNAYDLVDEHFESPLVKGAIALDAVIGTEFAPRTPGTVISYLYRLGAEYAAGNSLAQPQGGMGSVSAALVKAAEAAGVTLKLKSPVARILVSRADSSQGYDDEYAPDYASGVVTVNGTEYHANHIVSNVDPKTTVLQLAGPQHFDTDFVRRINNIRMKGVSGKLHLALKALPEFKGLSRLELGNRLLIAPSSEAIERAIDPTKYGEFAEQPVLEITIPTLADPSLAPAGTHLLSAVVVGIPTELKGGWKAESRKALLKNVMAVLESYAPGIGKLVVQSELLTPSDIAEEFALPGGCWHQGSLTFDQFYFMRPTYGASQYQTPLKGLYLCGAGNHPGGGVMGLAGYNAAQQVLRHPIKNQNSKG
ncbi:MAG: NAD(P)/FAD-dependent oxidoreductase [Candidatus Pacebacteria bacterium]|nr:NAD(P)/FAD-dependent oxidoreductase [Candidatus Paceibacterota bacterium]